MSKPDHEHKWESGGQVRVNRVSASPCSRMDDHLWTDVMLVQTCECGAVRRVKVGEENLRRRGDDMRRAVGKAPLGRPLV